MVQQGMTFQHKQPLKKRLWKARWFYLLMLPGILYFIIYKYVPMFGLVMAFQDYSPSLGFFASPWVGLKHFDQFFSYGQFEHLFSNTLIISLLCLVFSFPAPVILALFLNEIRHKGFKRVTQTLMYLPHFLSAVVVCSITYQLFSVEDGVINHILNALGFESVNVLMNEAAYRSLFVGLEIWQGTGWGTIIYLAALSSVDVQMYEASMLEGANRWQQILHVTLPGIAPTIVMMFILRLGGMMDAGFSQILVMYNPTVYKSGDIIGTYVDRIGLGQLNFSQGTLVGLFNSVVNCILMLGGNMLSRKLTEKSIW